MPLYRALLHSLDNYGLSRTLARAVRRAFRLPVASSVKPGFTGDGPHPFDLLHGTSTSGFVPGAQLTSGSNSDLYNTAYYGISPSSLTHALALLPPLPPGTTFMDIGCGKGRALLVAAQSTVFAQLTGVDLSPTLCAAARSNAAHLQLPHVTILEHDATTLTFPPGPLVLFLYYPFLSQLMRRFLSNLEQQRTHSPHPTYLLFANPQYTRLLTRFPFLHQLWLHDLPLSPEDALADRFGTTAERYALYST